MGKGYIFAYVHVRDEKKFREMAKQVIGEHGAKVFIHYPNAIIGRNLNVF